MNLRLQSHYNCLVHFCSPNPGMFSCLFSSLGLVGKLIWMSKLLKPENGAFSLLPRDPWCGLFGVRKQSDSSYGQKIESGPKNRATRV